MAESPNTAICLVTDAQVSASPEKSIGTKGLLKTILQKGNSWQTPIPGDEVEGTNIYFYQGTIFMDLTTVS